MLITDVTGVMLIPGNQGNDCPGNGTNPNIECCCDECDYMLCCYHAMPVNLCNECKDYNCPRAAKREDTELPGEVSMVRR